MVKVKNPIPTDSQAALLRSLRREPARVESELGDRCFYELEPQWTRVTGTSKETWGRSGQRELTAHGLEALERYEQENGRG